MQAEISGNILWGPPGSWEFRRGIIRIEDGRIAEFCDSGQRGGADFRNARIVPGFIDVHTHGAMGCDFADEDDSGLDRLAAYYAAHGVTGVYPTLSALPVDKLATALDRLAAVIGRGDYKIFKGLHLEGPCLHPTYAGAQNPEALAEPSIELFARLADAARGHVRLVTMAPELPGGIETAGWLSGRGIKVSVGHSNATYGEAMQAFSNGVDCVGHFLNAMRAFHQHEPSIPGAVAMSENVFVEAICDGFHLVPATVAVLEKTLGLERIVCVTDSIAAAGMGDGRYTISSFSQPLDVTDGDAKIAATGVRAGSTLAMDAALRNFMRFTGKPLSEAVKCFTANPARRMGIFYDCGSIEAGKRADFAVLDEQLNVIATIAGGELIYV